MHAWLQPNFLPLVFPAINMALCGCSDYFRIAAKSSELLGCGGEFQWLRYMYIIVYIYVYIYIYVYYCIYLCVYIHMYIIIYISIHNVYIYIHIYICLYSCIYRLVFVWKWTQYCTPCPFETPFVYFARHVKKRFWSVRLVQGSIQRYIPSIAIAIKISQCSPVKST